ncbi:hypothetical protein F1880_001399 [Penicillium rolfsii]|nr:hypothetical protein F1880_001399 [Penicillium rolfsii]
MPTGEHISIHRDSSKELDDVEIGPGDQINIAFSSKIITKGHSHGILFAAVSFTEIGAIAASLKESGKDGDTQSSRQDSGRSNGFAHYIKAGMSKYSLTL